MSYEKQKRHVLNNLVIAEWHHIVLDTIYVEDGANLLTGENGSGKTSVLDAIQFVFMGGDQRKTQLNAANNRNIKSTRSVKSYCLASEENGKHRRNNSNTSIILNWHDEEQNPYSYGLTIAASENSTEINWVGHIVKGAHISQEDLINDYDELITYKELNQKLKDYAESSEGKIKYDTYTRSETMRAKICEVMSGSEYDKIDHEQLIKIVSKAMNINLDLGIDEFIQTLILPENNVNMPELRAHLQDYEHITQQMKFTKQQKTEREEIIQIAENISEKSLIVHNWEYSELLASFYCSDTEHKKMLNEKTKLEFKIKKAQEDWNAAVDSIPKLEKDLQDAEEAFYKSDTAHFDRMHEHAKLQVEEQSQKLSSLVENLNNQISSINRLHLPKVENCIAEYDTLLNTFEDYKSSENFSNISQLNIVNLESNISVLDNQTAVVDTFELMSEQSYEASIKLTNRRDDIKNNGIEISRRIKNLEDGGSDISPSTQYTLSLLAKNGIQATPLCDVCEITDESWVDAIERFFGDNREAILVSKDDYLKSVHLLYNLGERDKAKVQKTKIVVPSKVRANFVAKENSIASIIETDHPLARSFVNLHAGDVILTEDFEELIHFDKGVIKTFGVSSGVGTFGSNSEVDGFLFGKKSRELTLSRLQAERNILSQQLSNVETPLNAVEVIRRTLSAKIYGFGQALSDCRIVNSDLINARKRLAEAEKNNKPMSDADKQLLKHKEAVSATLNNVRDKKSRAETILENSDEISVLVSKVEYFSKEMTEAKEKLEKHKAGELHDEAKAMDYFKTLKSEDETEDKVTWYSNIRKTANSKRESEQKKLVKERGNLRAKVSIFLEKGYIEDEAKRRLYLDSSRDDDNAYKNIQQDCVQWIKNIGDKKLLTYQKQAEEAEEKMSRNFRGLVVGDLKERFSEMDMTIRQLNQALKPIIFHGKTYQFTYRAKKGDVFSDILNYLDQASPEETELVDTMFSSEAHPAIQLIKAALLNDDELVNQISDYRNFYTFDMVIKDGNSDEGRRISALQKTGSGGEIKTPSYIALAAAFLNAYKINPDKPQRGASLVLLDEVFEKMDEGNTRASIEFLKSMGLQLILAAPPDMSMKIGGLMDQQITVNRDKYDVLFDYHVLHPEGQKLLDDSNPDFNEELVDKRAEELRKGHEEASIGSMLSETY